MIHKEEEDDYMSNKTQNLEKFVPEVGVVLDLVCIDLAKMHGCPSEILHPNFEYKGSCAGNCPDDDRPEDVKECWKDMYLKKAKEYQINLKS